MPPVIKENLKTVFNPIVINTILVFLLLFGSKLTGQYADTSKLIVIIQSDAKFEDKIKAYNDLCEELLNTKEYHKLGKFSKEFFKFSNQGDDKKAIIDAAFFLVQSSYSLKEWDQCAYYSKIGLGHAKQILYKKKEAYFNNILGITERRMDNCEGAIQYYLNAIAINKEILDSVTLAINYNNLSRCYRSTGQIAKSLEILKEGLRIRQQLQDTTGMANAYMNIGNTYNDVNNYEKAIDNYLEANNNYKLTSNNAMYAGSLLNIGLVYQNLNDYENAILYYNQVKDFAQGNEPTSILGIVYQNLGNVYSNQGNANEAIKSQKKALEIFNKLDQIGDQNDALLNIGIEYSKLGKIDSALFYLNESLKISNLTQDFHDISNVYLEIGRLHTRTNRFSLALDQLRKGLAIATSRKDLEMQSFANQYLYELYEKMGNSAEALYHYKIYQNQQDSLNLMEQEKSVTKIKAQYDFEKQEDEIELLNKENLLKEAEVNKIINQRKLLLALLALFGLAIGGVSFLFRYSKRKNRIITQEKEKAEKLLLNIFLQKRPKN
jgi:tetratricopeptide (TPR) repeat protein